MIRCETPRWQRVVAACGLVATSPILAAGAAVVKASSPGPILYRSRRAGVRGRPFLIHKLRTMHVGSDSAGSITSVDDQRVFPAGRWLRRFKIDELPQLWNVVAGEMALVGPRPEAMEVVMASYRPWMMETLEVPPGITSPGSLHYFQQEQELPRRTDEAQIIYTRELLPRKLAIELVYVRHRSTSYEVRIIGRTILGILGARDPAHRLAHRELAEAEEILAGLSVQERS